MARRPASLLTVSLICTGIIVISTIGEFIPGLLAPIFEIELDTPGTVIGTLVATIFLTSGICAFPAGWITDRISPEKLTALQLGFASVAFGGFAISTNSTHLFIVCVMVGVTMAFNQPSTNRIILHYLPIRHQAAAIGWRSVGVQVSMALCSLIFAVTSGLLSWRLVVVAVTILMLVAGLWMYLVFRNLQPLAPASAVPLTKAENPNSGLQRTRPITWWMIPYSLFTSGAISSVGAYLVIFGTDELGLTLAGASFASGVYATISLLARVYWVKFMREENQVLLLLLASISTAVAFVFLAFTPQLGEWSFWVASVLIGAASTGAGPLSQIVTVKNANPAAIGAVSGWVSMGTFAGLTLQPVLLAIFIGHFGLTASWLVVAGASLLGSVTIIVFWIANRPKPRSLA